MSKMGALDVRFAFADVLEEVFAGIIVLTDIASKNPGTVLGIVDDMREVLAETPDSGIKENLVAAVADLVEDFALSAYKPSGPEN